MVKVLLPPELTVVVPAGEMLPLALAVAVIEYDGVVLAAVKLAVMV